MGAENQVSQQALVQRAVHGIHGQTIAAGLVGVLVAAILTGIGFIAGVMWKPMSPTGQTEQFNFISAPLQNKSVHPVVCLWRVNRKTGNVELLVGSLGYRKSLTVLKEGMASLSTDASSDSENPFVEQLRREGLLTR
ncbi:MAG TPA: hypothetical protein PK251_11935 [Candidatus Latescibacteria bacterium]|nr:hypothetical protein [Candidatus Latescibacterota bacterium]HPK74584.1 hypothetical protein [Candidatus Latescibacterota bacterium]